MCTVWVCTELVCMCAVNGGVGILCVGLYQSD